MKNIYLFTGNEELIIKNKIDNVIKNINANAMNISTYNLDDVNISEVIQDAMTPPFMGDVKILVIKKPVFLTSSKVDIIHNTKMFMDYISNPFESTYLLIDCAGLKLDEKKDYVMKLLKVAEVSQTKDLSNVELEGWLKRQLAIEGIEIRDDAIKAFFARSGKSLLNAKKEVEKLILYVKPRNIVTISDVEDVVTKELEQDVFALTNAIVAKDNEMVLSIYRQLIEGGRDVMQLIGLVSKSFSDILIVNKMLSRELKQKEIISLLNISSGRAYHLIKNARSFKTREVEEYVIQLANLDYKIKSGKIDSKSGMELFLYGLGV
ncbi:MAG: DNA polymerase III subunit delta [Bacilli bacterium]